MIATVCVSPLKRSIKLFNSRMLVSIETWDECYRGFFQVTNKIKREATKVARWYRFLNTTLTQTHTLFREREREN